MIDNMKKNILILIAAALLSVCGCSGQNLNPEINGSISGMTGREQREFTRTSQVYTGVGRKYTIDIVGAVMSAGPNWGNITSVDVVLEYVSLSGNLLFGDDSGHPDPEDPTRATFHFSMPLRNGDVDKTKIIARRGVGGFDKCVYLMPNTGAGHYDIIMTATHGSESVRLTFYSFQINP